MTEFLNRSKISCMQLFVDDQMATETVMIVNIRKTKEVFHAYICCFRASACTTKGRLHAVFLIRSLNMLVLSGIMWSALLGKFTRGVGLVKKTLGNSADKLCHTISVAYSVVLVVIIKFKCARPNSIICFSDEQITYKQGLLSPQIWIQNRAQSPQH